MAKTNIVFNNTSYSIEEASLSAATADLRAHLSNTMNGSGAVIDFGGTSYNIDSAKLTAATNEFVSHLGTIAGSGSKVMVNGVEYGIDSAKVAGAVSELDTALGSLNEERLEGDGAEYYTLAPTALSFRSTAPLNELQEIQINGVTVDPSNYTLEEGSTIVTFPIEYLKTLDVGSYEVAVASDSKTVKGDFTVAAPELNEHGFYYNQPYTANVPTFGGTTVFFLREEGTMDVTVLDNGYAETCSYTADGSSLTINAAAGTFTGTASETGIYCNELYTNFVLGDTSIAADEDYIYIYKEDLGGYEVRCIDKTKSEYSAIKTGINGIDTVKLADEMFLMRSDNYTMVYNYTLMRVPQMPNSITIIGNRAFSGCVNITSIGIPNNVTTIGYAAFNTCDALTEIVIPDGVTVIEDSLLDGCEGLTDVTIGSGVTKIQYGAIARCTRLTNIRFMGTVAQWNAIEKQVGWINSATPATHVQCIDGTVAL